MWFESWSAVLRVIFLSVLTYTVLTALIRVFGKRTIAKMNPGDFVVTVAIGSVAGSVIIFNEVPVVNGFAALAALLAMALVENAGDGESESVVVETTPRIRRTHPKWTKMRLTPWLDSSLPVRITGWTFLDPEHSNHLGRYRSTLWEIHPITKIEVKQGNRWVDLDNLP